jgi:hypothetical protein
MRELDTRDANTLMTEVAAEAIARVIHRRILAPTRTQFAVIW